jgi:N utilization substance protein B
MSTRRRAREVALQVLYQFDFNPTAAAADLHRFLEVRLRLPGVVGFAEALVTGVTTERERIDQLLDERSEHWRVSRMAATDRAVLRLAIYELACSETPGAVIVDEAIELARRYGAAGSPAFVSGILGRCLTDREQLQERLEEDESPAPSVTDTP